VLTPSGIGLPAALWLVRHGESEGNIANTLARRERALRLDLNVNDSEVSLSDTGRTQAKALGTWIGDLPSDERPTMAVVSPYERTRETAEIVLAEAGLSSLPLHYDERLRDREQGVLDRLTGAGFRDAYPEEAERAQYVGKFWYRPTGGESWADVILRIRASLLEARLFWPDERILVVSHDMPILGFRYVLEELTTADVLAMSGTVQNCSVTRYEQVAGALVLEHFADTTALDESSAAPVTAHE
jgi:broad specificity phosphatase PhoE